jgi:hypothetical protein
VVRNGAHEARTGRDRGLVVRRFRAGCQGEPVRERTALPLPARFAPGLARTSAGAALHTDFPVAGQLIRYPQPARHPEREAGHCSGAAASSQNRALMPAGYGDMARSRLSEPSATSRLPAGDTATAPTLASRALVAGPPSPRVAPPPAMS